MPRGGLTPSESGRWPLSAADVVGSLVAVVTVALAQPLLDLLGRNAAFLVAHNARPAEVVALAVALPIGVPLVLAAIVLAVGRADVRAGSLLHATLLAVFGVVLGLVVAGLSGLDARIPAPAVVVLALLIGTAVVVLYRASPGVRRAANVAAFAAPIVAVAFVVASPARALVFPQPPTPPLAGIDAEPPDIVFVMFDELPIASLLTDQGRIDARAYPSFARLAADATLYTNATTVHGQTSDALPAALSGRYPDSEKLPVASDHPDNLLALLSGSHDIHAVEPLTELCPPAQCPPAPGAGDGRYARLLRDLAIVGSHLVLPEDLSGSLPPIDQGWRDFRGEAAAAGKEIAVRDRFRAARAESPVAAFDEFLGGVAPGQRPTLHFLHLLLPHSPWNYLPSGQQYNSTRYPPGLDRGRWEADPWQVAQAYQRHLLQVQLTDNLLGRLLDRLDEQQMYDDTIVVVMADHGASFTPQTSLRVPEPPTLGEIGAVPVLIKRPGRNGGEVSDRPIEIVDVAPTLLDLLGADIPDGVDGTSAVSGTPNDVRQIYSPGGPLSFRPDGSEKWHAVDRRRQWFGRSDAFAFPFGLVPRGQEHLLGRSTPTDPPIAGGLTVSLDGAAAYDDVDLAREPVPQMVEGTVVGSGERQVVAIGVNGRIVAVTLSDPAGTGAFRAVLPTGVLRPGENALEVFVVDEDGRLAVVPAT
ncbi:MAG TPA: sulfatase-like hydrolase/transferase [Egibacteraceae bacterium]|nr:sulfatase-like hydrolase/transferase [Egibacteraceae bacterium]